MERNDDKAPATTQQLDRARKSVAEGSELVVDRDAEGLECAGGRMNGAGATAD